MLNFNLFETLNVSCLCRKPKVTGDDEEVEKLIDEFSDRVRIPFK